MVQANTALRFISCAPLSNTKSCCHKHNGFSSKSSYCVNANKPGQDLASESSYKLLLNHKGKLSEQNLRNDFGWRLLQRARTMPLMTSKIQQASGVTIASVVGAGGGDFGSFGGGHGWGGDGGGSDHPLGSALRATSAQADDTNLQSEAEDVIILDVKGMSCGGCASSVKRILESQPQVVAATVDLPTETAFVQVKSLVDSVSEWQSVKTKLGHSLADCLTSSGFKSSVRGDSTPSP